MTLVDLAPWTALGAAIVAALIVVITGTSAWRQLRRTAATRAAASSLMDAHLSRLDAAVEHARAGSTRTDAGTQRLRASLAALQQDVALLRWLLQQIPEQRARLRRELLDLVLPYRG